MSGVAIGTSLGLGYAGSLTRQDDNLVRNRINSDTTNITFGTPVVLATDNTVKNWAADSTAATFAGVALANVKTNTTYALTNANAGYYATKTPTDVVERGSVNVFCKNGTPTAGGAVYIRVVAASPKAIGDFEAVADSTNSLIIPNAKWTTGKIDASLIAELTILTRVNP